MNPIQTIMLRARRYWFVDGIRELVIGVVLLTDGLAALVASVWPHTIIFPAVLLMTGIVGPYLARRLQETITYPRTGYASFPPISSSILKVSLLMLALVIIMNFLNLPGVLQAITESNPALDRPVTILRNLSTNGTPLLLGGGIAALLAVLAREYDLTRFYGFAIISALIGGGLFIASLMNSPLFGGAGFMSTLAMGIYFTLMGLALLGSGLLTFRAYLRQHHAPMEEAR